MTISQSLGQHLPYLRRYARALSGSQASGDAYVAATLEALVEDPNVLAGDTSTRIALYRLFTKIWNSVGVNGQGRRWRRQSAGGAPSRRRSRRCRGRRFC